MPIGKSKTAADELAEALCDSETADEFFDAIDKIAEAELESELEVEDASTYTAGSIPTSASATKPGTSSSTTPSTSKTSKGGTSNMFKVGDIIVGKEPPENGYFVLDSKSISEVLEANDEGILTVKLLYTDNPTINTARYLNKEYPNTAANAFRLATSEEKMKAYAKAASKSKAKEKPDVTIQLKTELIIQRFKDGTISSSFNTMRNTLPELDDERVKALNKIVDTYSSMSKAEQKVLKISKLMEDPDVSSVFDPIFGDRYVTSMLEKMIMFFKEFQFEPNFRFINTLALKSANEGHKAALEYVKCYFALTNSPFADAISDKIKSPEFKEMVYAIGTRDCSKVINSRFKVYYGSQGTGKTTKAMIETSGRCIVCNNSMLPQDLMEDFTFDDGKPGFHPSVLCECMQNGTGIVLDEINLLPFETIRFLQGIVDGKKEFIWKGNNIQINDGFNIIGTLNLVVNGMTFGLPEPLVDRCSDIEESHLTASMLMGCLD